MNDQTKHFDQVDEEILTYTVSDEALEAAAGTERGAMSAPALDYKTVPWTMAPPGTCGC
jgi:hypothetical protein